MSTAPSPSSAKSGAIQRYGKAVQANAFCHELPSSVLERLLTESSIQVYPQETILFDEGDAANHFYLVLEGSVQITRQALDAKSRVVLGAATAGSFFGDFALLARVPRTARATCKERTTLLSLDADAFRSILEEASTSVTRNLLEQAVKQLNQNNERTVGQLIEDQKAQVLRSVVRSLTEENQDLLTTVRLLSSDLLRRMEGTTTEPLVKELDTELETYVQRSRDLYEFTHGTRQGAQTAGDVRDWWQVERRDYLPLFSDTGIPFSDYAEALHFRTDFKLLSRLLRQVFMRIVKMHPSGHPLEFRIGRRNHEIHFQFTYEHPGLTEYLALRIAEPFLPYAPGKTTWVDFALAKQWTEHLGGRFSIFNRMGERLSLSAAFPLIDE